VERSASMAMLGVGREVARSWARLETEGKG
jgi:hypothetical protein